MQQSRTLRAGLLALGVVLAIPSLAHAQQQTVKVGVVPALGTSNQVPASGSSLFVDLMAAIATEARVEVEFHAVPFGDHIAAVISGELDVGAAPFAITDERRALGVEFTSPVAALEDALLVAANDPKEYRSVADLRGEVVGTTAGTIWEATIKNAGAELKTYPDVADLVPALASREIKAAVVASANRYILEVQRPDPRVRFANAYVPTARNDGSLVVRRDDAALLTKLNAAITRLKAKGNFLPELTRKYGYLMPRG